jgi:hypothetical protein
MVVKPRIITDTCSSMYSDRLEYALRLAAHRHRTHVRKGSTTPYITHLMHVAFLLKRYGHDEDTCILGLLHDILEDTCRTPEEQFLLSQEIGENLDHSLVTDLQTLSEPLQDLDGTPLPWKKRKSTYLHQLENASPRALAVSAADKIHNVADTLAEIRIRGFSHLDLFSGSPAESLWFYDNVCDTIARRLGPTELAAELRRQVNAFASLTEDLRRTHDPKPG